MRPNFMLRPILRGNKGKLFETGITSETAQFRQFRLARQKRQRPGWKPKTGDDIPITAHHVVTFKPDQKLKAKNDNLSDYQRTANLIENKRQSQPPQCYSVDVENPSPSNDDCQSKAMAAEFRCNGRRLPPEE